MEVSYLNVIVTVLGFIGTALLSIIAYFLQQLHSDFKSLKQTVEEHSTSLAVGDERMSQHESRLMRLENKLFDAK
jgi:hypothetical protein